MKVSFRRIAKAMSQNLHKFFFLPVVSSSHYQDMWNHMLLANQPSHRYWAYLQKERERERTQLMEQQFKTAKKSTEIANNLPRANSILFSPAKRPFDGSLNPFFPVPFAVEPGTAFYFPLTLALFSWLISSPVPPSTRRQKKSCTSTLQTAHTHTPSSPFCSTLLHIPLLHACVCSKKASPVFVRARAKLAYCDVCLSVYIKVIKASDLKEAEKRDSPTQR